MTRSSWSRRTWRTSKVGGGSGSTGVSIVIRSYRYFPSILVLIILIHAEIIVILSSFMTLSVRVPADADTPRQ
jgi:hypothetical protein